MPQSGVSNTVVLRPAAAVTRVVKSVEPYAFERIYGGWFWTRIEGDAKGAVASSAERHLRALSA